MSAIQKYIKLINAQDEIILKIEDHIVFSICLNAYRLKYATSVHEIWWIFKKEGKEYEYRLCSNTPNIEVEQIYKQLLNEYKAFLNDKHESEFILDPYKYAVDDADYSAKWFNAMIADQMEELKYVQEKLNNLLYRQQLFYKRTRGNE